MNGQEQELKLRVSCADDYERLCAALPAFTGEIEQHNHYWDHPDGRLRANGVMLRIRLTDERAVVTVKKKARRGEDGFFEAQEDEVDVSLEAARRVIAGDENLAILDAEPIRALDEEFGSATEFAVWGTMSNRRRCYQLADDLVAEVDRSDFGKGGVHFEIEIESSDPDRARARLKPILQSAGIEVEPSTMTKSERLNALQDAP